MNWFSTEFMHIVYLLYSNDLKLLGKGVQKRNIQFYIFGDFVGISYKTKQDFQIQLCSFHVSSGFIFYFTNLTHTILLDHQSFGIIFLLSLYVQFYLNLNSHWFSNLIHSIRNSRLNLIKIEIQTWIIIQYVYFY